jgi:hypothetical protein
MTSLSSVMLVAASSLVLFGESYKTSLTMCGNPSSPKMSDGYECAGALFTAVDINKLNTLKNENGCVAGMLGLSTQLKGHHCLAFKNCPGAGCTCEVRQGCSSSKAASATTKACLYGVKQVSECPADAPAAGSSGVPTSSAMSEKGSLIMLVVLVLLNCLLGASADYNTSLSMCGNPSSPKTSEGYECTGALFTLVDINKLNTLKNENGCVAGMLGLSTQLKGYHCLAFKNCPGAGCTCEVRQGCSSSKAASATTKACLYGVKQASECPADAPTGSSSDVPTSSCKTQHALAIGVVCAIMVAMANVLQFNLQ